jgi:hypothetical protein
VFPLGLICSKRPFSAASFSTAQAAVQQAEKMLKICYFSDADRHKYFDFGDEKRPERGLARFRNNH